MDKVYEIVGWVGALALLVGYMLNSFGVVSSASVEYQMINIIGSLGIVAISYKKKAFQPMTLNIVWLGIALLALVRMM